MIKLPKQLDMTPKINLTLTANYYQGSFKRVLAVCSAGLLRSPTIAWVLSQPPWNFNTRSCGVMPEFALVPFSLELLVWADEIVCANTDHFNVVMTHALRNHEHLCELDKPIPKVHNFELPDDFEFRDPTLVKMIEEQAKSIWKMER